MSFYCRLIDYGLSVTKRHSTPPVILAIIIHNTTTELSNLAVASEKHSFLLELPCHGWAKSCYLLNSSSISDHLQLTSLNPLVALGHFLIQQKLSLRFIDRNDDQTIQLLYTIAQQIFGEGLKENDLVITEEDLEKIHDQCTRAKSYLLEDVSDESSRKRTMDCLGVQQVVTRKVQAFEVWELQIHCKKGGVDCIQRFQHVDLYQKRRLFALFLANRYKSRHTDIKLPVSCSSDKRKQDARLH